MPVLLVRHAKAGDRSSWDGPDPLRPLSRKGQLQADALVVLLGNEPITSILSSRYVRCTQTVEPLARKLSLPVETHKALAEGASVSAGVKLLWAVAGTTTVLCSHGDIVPTMLDTLAHTDGLPLPEDFEYAKGSTWVLRDDGKGRYVSAEYLPPPPP